MYRVGASALQSGLAHSLVMLLRAMGTPRQVFRQLPRAVAKFSTTSTMEIVESGATSATIRFTLHPGFAHSRLDCIYAQGLITTVPTVFGLPAGRDRARRVRVRRCAVLHLPAELGAAQPAAPPPARPAGDRPGADRAARAAAHPAVGGHRPGRQRRRRQRAAAHRRPRRRGGAGARYLLAVRGPGGGEPLVHSAGLDPSAVPQLVGPCSTAGTSARARWWSTSSRRAGATAGWPPSTRPGRRRAWATSARCSPPTPATPPPPWTC